MNDGFMLKLKIPSAYKNTHGSLQPEGNIDCKIILLISPYCGRCVCAHPPKQRNGVS